MKTRLVIAVVILGVTVLLGIPVLRAQGPPQPSTSPMQPRAPLTNVQNVQNAPNAPDPPSRPNPPNPQHPPNPPNPPNPDPLGDVMFPPDMIMRHARQIGLTDEQKAFMRGEIQRTTTRFNELQWQLEDAMELLHQTMKSNSVDEQQALSQLDKLLDTERQIKRLHIGLGIRIKNQLTPEQQAKLHAMRMGPWPEGQPRPGQQP